MTEENGLVCAFVLDGKGRGQPLVWDGMKKWRMEDGTLWAHLDCSVESAGDWLLNQSGLEGCSTK